MQTIQRRVQNLEKVCAQSCQVREAEERAARTDHIEKVREILRRRGVVQEPHESLAEAFARALGVTCLQLRSLLAARAAGAISR